MYKNILSSTLPLIITLILFAVVGSYGIGRVQGLRAEISQAENDKAALTQKLDVLRTVSATVQSGSAAAASALPEKNSSLIEFSQLKALATLNTITLFNLKSGSEIKEPSGLSRADLSFEVTGPRASVITFLEAVERAAPVSLVAKIRLSESEGVAHATVSVSTFWAAFPKNIPAVTEAITDLTQDERSTLEKVISLTQPQFVEVPAGEGAGKTDPFAP